MVNTMDLGRGFLKLQEDNNSRRSSSLFRQKPLELNENGLHYVTRINCGCGQCVPFRVKVEKDDGGLRIGKLTLATNCHLIIVIFGFFFLIAGSVLTALAYKEPIPDPDLPVHARASTEQLDSPSRQEGKVAGPIFIIVGSCLILVGFTLTALACKLNREAKRQLHLSRFTWETPPIQTPDIFNNSATNSHYHSVSSPGPDHYATFSTNNLDTFSVRSRELSTGSAGSGGPRRDSSFTFHRQQQHPPPPLSTIAQAVPVGIFLFGGGDQATASPRSPTIQVTDPSGFQEIELGSPTTESAPTSASAFSSRGSAPADSAAQQQPYYYNYGRKHRSQSASDGASVENVMTKGGGGSPGDDGGSKRGGETNRNLNPTDDPTGAGQPSKVNLALRPSLPIIPMFATSSPHYFSRVVTPLDARSLYVSSRSDEPFGSIASLSTSGDIACFPVTSSSNTTTNNGSGGAGGTAVTATHGGININMQPTPECDEESSTATTSTSSSSVITAPRILSSGGGVDASANKNANDISNKKNANVSSSVMERNRKNNSSCNASADYEDVANKLTMGSSISSSNSHSDGKGISELPPINVNDSGSKMNSSGSSGSVASHVTGAAVGFRPKSILRQSQSEDWQEGSSEGGDGGEKQEKA